MTTETMLMAKQIVARSMNWPNRNNGSKFRTECQINELMLYEVRNGKIVLEQFFY